MTSSTNLALPFVAAGQAQKHVTVNESLRKLDALVQIGLKDRDLSAPPGSPVDGDRYLVAASPSGAWAGQAGKLAAWQDGAWTFHVPRVGWTAWIADEAKLIAFDGTVWRDAGGAVNPTPLVGVNATADTTNRLSVNAPATLLNHDGAGHQLKINKAAAADTASLLFQRGFSGRAEFGLMGDDDFRLKVSANGSAWLDAMRVDRATGAVSFPYTLPGVTQRSFAALTFPAPAAGTAFYCPDAPIGPALVVSDGAAYRMTAVGTLYQAPVTLRDPTATDDANKGYAAGDTWINLQSGAQFAASSVTAGAASWAAVSSSSLPLDSVSGAAAAYGVMKLRSAYSGPAFQLRRASDNATQDIGFTAQGVADWAAAATFAGSAAVHLSVWYDQTGNGHHMTQTTTASQPQQFLTNRVGGRVGLDFIQGFHMLLPSGLSLARQGLTALAAIAPNGSAVANHATFGSAQAFFGTFNSGDLLLFNGVSNMGVGSWHVDEGVQVAQWLSGGAARWADDRKVSNGIATSAATMTGGAVGNASGTLNARYGALIFYPSALSDTDVQTVQRSLSRSFQFTPQIRDRLVMIGDSITHGAGAADNFGFAQRVRASLLRRYQILNLGVSAQTLATQAGQVSTYTKFVLSGTLDVAHVFSGTNDLSAAGSVSTLQTNMQTFCAALKSGGFQKVIVGTLLPRAGGFSGGQTASGFETARQTFNTWLRSNWSTFADGLADYGGHAIMGAEATASNTTYFADTIHPTSSGHALLTDVAAAAVNTLG